MTHDDSDEMPSARTRVTDLADPRGMLDIVFDEVPTPEDRSGPTLAFVEVEKNGESVSRGEWTEEEDGRHVLTIPDPEPEVSLDDLLFALQAELLDQCVRADGRLENGLWAQAMQYHGETIATIQRLRHQLDAAEDGDA